VADVSLHKDLAGAQAVSKIQTALSTQFQDERPYHIVILASLALWFFGTQILYMLIDGPDVTTQNRAVGFAIKMVFYGSIYLMFWAVLRLFQFARRTGNRSLITAFSQACSKHPMRPLIWIIHAGFALITYVLLMTNFMSVKTLIPDMIPFYLDPIAYKVDRVLFLGRDPWTIFSWVYEFPKIVVTIDRIYTAWAGLIIGVWIYCFTTRAIPLRQRYQYIISMIVLWFLGGNVMATLLSSAGPCYYEYFTGSEVYQPLTSQLAIIHEAHFLGAYDYFDVLLTMYENKETRFAGISAAPSLHCASSFMILLLFWKNKIIRTLLIAFNITIFLGSIILAWHYAIDGIIGILLALLCWWIGYKIVDKIGMSKSHLT